MTRLLAPALVLLALAAALLGQAPAPAPSVADTFITADVFIDSGPAPLAAWQVEFTGTLGGGGRGTVELVGIEGGDPGPFAQPAYYDPAALAGNRVVLGAFTTQAAGLPTGRTRVARLHLHVSGPAGAAPTLSTTLIAAADAAGAPIHATTTASRENDTP